MIQLDIFYKELGDCDPSVSNCTDTNLINCNRSEGVIPRGLWLELRGGTMNSTVVIGPNPGVSKKGERAKIGFDRSLQTENWKRHFADTVLFDYCYYTGVRGLLEALDQTGDILWSELYKCEHQVRRGKNKIGFMGEIAEICTARFLRKELQSFAEQYDNYLVVACGEECYNFLLQKKQTDWKELIPKLLGIYHPSGPSRWLFEDKYFEARKDYRLRSEFANLDPESITSLLLRHSKWARNPNLHNWG